MERPALFIGFKILIFVVGGVWRSMRMQVKVVRVEMARGEAQIKGLKNAGYYANYSI